MPSVVMNDGTPVVTVMVPLTRPTPAAPARANTIASGSGQPHSVACHMSNGVQRVDVPQRQVELPGDQQSSSGRRPGSPPTR